jgi:hypothetical protein
MDKLIFGIIHDPALAIATLFLGFLIGNRFAIGRDRRKDFNKAATDFRDAFVKEQRLLDPHSCADRVGLSVSNIIKDAIDRHEIAMIRFEPFVCKSKIEEHCCPN